MLKKVGIISQARMTSTRLPAKVMLLANGKTVLEHHLNRLAWSGVPVYLATTSNLTDDPLVELSNKLNVPFFRGDEHNVLERYFQCATQFQLDVIVRVTSDCPLIDGTIIRDCVNRYLKLDDERVYYSNCLQRTFPRGLDFEIFSLALLHDAYSNAKDPADKEHVTPYINKNKSGQVIIKDYKFPQDHSQLRWTLDTAEDWILLRKLIEDYHVEKSSYEEILDVFNRNPELIELNKLVKQKEV